MLDPMLVYGALGGLIPDAIRLVRSRHDPALPPYLKSAGFYLGLVFCVVLGALASWMLGATDVRQALACGFSAPEILTRLLSKTDGVPRSALEPAVARRPMALREWWGR